MFITMNDGINKTIRNIIGLKIERRPRISRNISEMEIMFRKST